MLVGEGNMLIASGLLLREAGMRISGVVSDDAAALQWASSLGLPTIGYGAELVASLERSPVDYLSAAGHKRCIVTKPCSKPPATPCAR